MCILQFSCIHIKKIFINKHPKFDQIWLHLTHSMFHQVSENLPSLSRILCEENLILKTLLALHNSGEGNFQRHSHSAGRSGSSVFTSDVITIGVDGWYRIIDHRNTEHYDVNVKSRRNRTSNLRIQTRM